MLTPATTTVSRSAGASQPAGIGLLDRPALRLFLICISLAVFLWPQVPFIFSALRLELPDSDDAMRLLSVRDFLAGQGWFDMHQYRYLPPEGASMHWSRLVDLPMAILIRLLAPFSGLEGALGFTAAAWPLALFGAYLAAAGFIVQRRWGSIAAVFAILVACQMAVFADIFGAGRIDHHNVVALSLTLAAGALIFSDNSARAPYLAGAACALSLAVSLEALPYVAGIGALYGVRWIFALDRGEEAIKRFGLSFATAALAVFVADTAPSEWQVAHCDALSSPWLLLAVGGGLMGVLLSQLSPRLRHWPARLITAATLAALLIAAFVTAFPACLGGPYGVVPEPFRSEWLGNIPEAFSFRRILATNPVAALRCYGPLITAAIAASVAISSSTRETRWGMTALALMLWIGALMCQFQIRSIYDVTSFIPLVAGWFLSRSLGVLQTAGTPWRKTATLACACVLFFELPWAFGPRAARALGFEPKYESFGGDLSPECIRARSVKALNALPPGVVLAPIDLGTHILVHTPHSIIAAGYHRAVGGIIAGIEAFSGSEEDMRRHAEQHHADYVVICPQWALAKPQSAAFARELAGGKTVSWLEPIKVESGPLMAWRVRR